MAEEVLVHIEQTSIKLEPQVIEMWREFMKDYQFYTFLKKEGIFDRRMGGKVILNYSQDGQEVKINKEEFGNGTFKREKV